MFSTQYYASINNGSDDPCHFYLIQLLAQYEKEWPDNPEFLDDYRDVYLLPEFQRALGEFQRKINSKYCEPNHQKRYIRTEMMGCIYLSETEAFRNLNQKIDSLLPKMTDVIKNFFIYLINAIQENPSIFMIGIGLFYQYYTQCQMAAASYTYDDSQKLEEAISKKIIYETGTTKSTCDEIKTPLLEISNNKEFSNQYLFYLLALPNFYFECTKWNGETNGASYSHTDQKIYYYQDPLPLAITLRHEMYHAVSNFLVLNSKECYIPNLPTGSVYYVHPIALTSPDVINGYHKDFEEGDKNIKKLAALIHKKKTDNLNRNEKVIYLEQIKPFEKMLPYYVDLLVPEHQIHTIARDATLWGYQLIEMKTIDGKHRGFFSIHNADALVGYLVRQLEFYQRRYPKEDTLPILRIIEREAHTFEVSTEVQKKFYGKAYARHLSLLKSCSDFSPEVKENDPALQAKKGL